ncbi:MAG: hypothetical protein H7175_14925 [Burkholderiales bacterium]|nr:hypothetical protein [Anaerolineae bacterium]
MFTRKLALFMLPLLLAVTPTLAQDTKGTPVPAVQAAAPAEIATLVQTAFTNLQNASSYHSETVASAHQVLSATGYNGDFVLDFNLSADVIPNGTDTMDNWDSSSTIDIHLEESNNNTQDIEVSVDTVMLDGQGFTRQTAGESQGLPLNVWLADGPTATGLPIPYDRMSLEPFSFLYLVDLQSALSASEMPAELLNGEPMRVFEVQLNPEVLRDLGVISLTGIGEGTNTNLTATFDGLGELTATTSYTLRVWVGTTDILPHRVDYTFDNNVSAQQQNANAVQSVVGTTMYSNFDVPLTITNPLESGPVAIATIIVEPGKPSAEATPSTVQSPAATEAVTSSGIGANISESDPLSVVSAAYANLQALDSYHAEGSASAAQTVTSSDTNADFALDFSFAMDVIPNGPDTVDTVMGTTAINLNMNQTGSTPQAIQAEIDLVIIDGQSYGRVNSANQDIGSPIGEWVAEAVPTGVLQIPYDRMNTEPFLFLYLVNPNTIASVVESSGATINGQAVRVFDVTLDPGVLQSLGVISQTGIGEGTSTNLTASFDGMGSLSTQTAYTLRILIGVEDGLPHEITYTFSNDITAQSGGGSAVQQVDGVIAYSNFNAPVSIIPPAL